MPPWFVPGNAESRVNKYKLAKIGMIK